MKRGVFILQVKIQPFRSTSEVPTQISGLPTITENTVHKESEVRACKSVSELPANVGTSDGRNSRRSSGLPTSTVNQTASTAEAGTPGLGQVSVGTPGERRDFRWLELPANVGTSDVHRQRAVRSTGARTPGLGRDFRLMGVSTLTCSCGLLTLCE